VFGGEVSVEVDVSLDRPPVFDPVDAARLVVPEVPRFVFKEVASASLVFAAYAVNPKEVQ
jgi:hypothetical protein